MVGRWWQRWLSFTTTVTPSHRWTPATCTPEPAPSAAPPPSPSASPHSFPTSPSIHHLLPPSLSFLLPSLHPISPHLDFCCTSSILLCHGVLRPLSGLPLHTGPAGGLPVCLCPLLLPRGLQGPGLRPGAHHWAGVWLLSTSWRLHQPQSSGSAASPASQLGHWPPGHRAAAERLPDPLPTAG